MASPIAPPPMMQIDPVTGQLRAGAADPYQTIIDQAIASGKLKPGDVGVDIGGYKANWFGGVANLTQGGGLAGYNIVDEWATPTDLKLSGGNAFPDWFGGWDPNNPWVGTPPKAVTDVLGAWDPKTMTFAGGWSPLMRPHAAGPTSAIPTTAYGFPGQGAIVWQAPGGQGISTGTPGYGSQPTGWTWGSTAHPGGNFWEGLLNGPIPMIAGTALAGVPGASSLLPEGLGSAFQAASWVAEPALTHIFPLTGSPSKPPMPTAGSGITAPGPLSGGPLSGSGPLGQVKTNPETGQPFTPDQMQRLATWAHPRVGQGEAAMGGSPVQSTPRPTASQIPPGMAQAAQHPAIAQTLMRANQGGPSSVQTPSWLQNISPQAAQQAYGARNQIIPSTGQAPTQDQLKRLAWLHQVLGR